MKAVLALAFMLLNVILLGAIIGLIPWFQILFWGVVFGALVFIAVFAWACLRLVIGLFS